MFGDTSRSAVVRTVSYRQIVAATTPYKSSTHAEVGQYSGYLGFEEFRHVRELSEPEARQPDYGVNKLLFGLSCSVQRIVTVAQGRSYEKNGTTAC